MSRKPTRNDLELERAPLTSSNIANATKYVPNEDLIDIQKRGKALYDASPELVTSRRNVKPTAAIAQHQEEVEIKKRKRLTRGREPAASSTVGNNNANSDDDGDDRPQPKKSRNKPGTAVHDSSDDELMLSPSRQTAPPATELSPEELQELEDDPEANESEQYPDPTLFTTPKGANRATISYTHVSPKAKQPTHKENRQAYVEQYNLQRLQDKRAQERARDSSTQPPSSPSPPLRNTTTYSRQPRLPLPGLQAPQHVATQPSTTTSKPTQPQLQPSRGSSQGASNPISRSSALASNTPRPPLPRPPPPPPPPPSHQTSRNNNTVPPVPTPRLTMNPPTRPVIAPNPANIARQANTQPRATSTQRALPPASGHHLHNRSTSVAMPNPVHAPPAAPQILPEGHDGPELEDTGGGVDVQTNRRRQRKSYKLKLTDFDPDTQAVLERAVLHYAAKISTDNAFPDKKTDYEFQCKSFTEAEQHYGDAYSTTLTTRCTRYIAQRDSTIRGRYKIAASAIAAAEFGFTSGSSSAVRKHNEDLAKMLIKQLLYTYEIRDPDPLKKQNLFGNPLFLKIIVAVLYHQDEALGFLFRDQFEPCPLPLIALVACVILNCIHEYEKGVHIQVNFTYKRYHSTYASLLASLKDWKAKCEPRVSYLCKSLSEQARDAYALLPDVQDAPDETEIPEEDMVADNNAFTQDMAGDHWFEEHLQQEIPRNGEDGQDGDPDGDLYQDIDPDDERNDQNFSPYEGGFTNERERDQTLEDRLGIAGDDADS